MMPTRPVWAEISRSSLLANWNLLRSAAPEDADVVAVIKADAYGHGALACAPLLEQAGATWFGVTCASEGIAFRQICEQPRILLMSGFWDGEPGAIIEHRLTPQVWEPYHFELLEEEGKRRRLAPQSVPVHLEIDTGMSRQGVRSLNDLKTVLENRAADSPVYIEGVMTHFSSPEVVDTRRKLGNAVCAAACACFEGTRAEASRPPDVADGDCPLWLSAPILAT
jgi:alanine racemase